MPGFFALSCAERRFKALVAGCAPRPQQAPPALRWRTRKGCEVAFAWALRAGDHPLGKTTRHWATGFQRSGTLHDAPITASALSLRPVPTWPTRYWHHEIGRA